MQHKTSQEIPAVAPPPRSAPSPPPEINSEIANVHARLNSLEDQLQQFLDRTEKSAHNPTTPPRIAGAKRQNTSDTPPLFKGTSTEVAFL
jgi:hypothetical protein